MPWLRFFFSFLILFAGFSGLAQPHCGSLVSGQAFYLSEAQKNLGKKISVETKRLGLYDIYEVVIFDSWNGDALAQLDVRLEPGEKNILIARIDVFKKENRRKGLGEALFEQALLLMPDARTVETTALVETNLEAAELALKNQGASPIDAIRNTPSYKMGARFGFTEIVPGSIHRDFQFTVRRP